MVPPGRPWKEGVCAALGVALVPESYSRLYHRIGVVYRQIKGELPTIEIAAIWKADNVSSALNGFLEVVRSAMK